MDGFRILIDEIVDKPTKEFRDLAAVLSEIIKKSDPQFTIGIYGEWGTGKTTMMNHIKNNLVPKGEDPKKSKILPIWFNAWRYEREEEFATIPLMKTIAYEMSDHYKFDEVSDLIKKSLIIVGTDIIKRFALKLMTEKGIEKFNKNFTKKADFLNKMDKDTIYFDGLNRIRKKMEDIRKEKDGDSYRVVVFIDDLDRCSPKKSIRSTGVH